MKKIGIIVFLIFMTNCCLCFAASFPYTLNYQGMLTNKIGQLVNEPQDITFNLYTTPIGTELPFWTDTLLKVPVTNGQFSVTLGTGITPLDPSKFGGDTYLGIKVGTQAEMLPRQKMTSVPYAFNGVPKGGIIMWSGAVVPDGWALCDGKNNTPDLRDRFIVGAGIGSSYAINASGGEAMHTLTIQELPQHSHPVDPPAAVTGGHSADHSHGFNAIPTGTEAAGYSLVKNAVGAGFTDRAYVTGSGGTNTYGASSNHTHTVDIPPFNSGPMGDGLPHENRPPYYALAYIIKL